MALVAYSDSEDSDGNAPQALTEKPASKSAPSFTLDKKTPGTIKVKIQQTNQTLSNGDHDDEPAAKRPRIGTGTLSGFNAMLPAPKRDGLSNTSIEGGKSNTRKIISLKTGAEASFDRASDVELRSSFVPNDTAAGETPRPAQQSGGLPLPPFAKPAAPAAGGTPFMFKPLSVSRTGRKKRPNQTPPNQALIEQQNSKKAPEAKDKEDPPMKKKINLFSVGNSEVSTLTETRIDLDPADDDQEPEMVETETTYLHHVPPHQSTDPNPQSLDSIASDLNLTTAQRRQLFGRSGQLGGSAINVVNFNTDDEYAANQALIAAGETVQHNPVRAIAPGKHSLRQLVNAAAGQKDALEESFAQGRQNKKEAGSKYGW